MACVHWDYLVVLLGLGQSICSSLNIIWTMPHNQGPNMGSEIFHFVVLQKIFCNKKPYMFFKGIQKIPGAYQYDIKLLPSVGIIQYKHAHMNNS
jgi:hypothetical protein